VASLQTRDCILLGSADMDHWSNSVDWRGSNFYNPHTSFDRTPCGRGHNIAVLATQEAPPPPPLLPSSSSAWRRMLSRQSTDQQCMCWKARRCPVLCRRLAVYLGLSNDHPRDNYRRSALFALDVRSCTISSDLWATWYHKVNESATDIATLRNKP